MKDQRPMLALALVLAAGVTHPQTTEGRVALLEARQMLESQQVWGLRADLPPEAVRALADVQLHVQHDQEQEDRVRDLTLLVVQMQARMTALELVLADRSLAESSTTRIPVAPMQLQPMHLPVARKPKKASVKAYKQAPASQPK